jgi:hypothetical protein
MFRDDLVEHFSSIASRTVEWNDFRRSLWVTSTLGRSVSSP